MGDRAHRRLDRDCPASRASPAAPRSGSSSATSSAPPRRSASRRGTSSARELLPNVAGPLLVEANLRLTYSIALIGALGFLGFGVGLNEADWAQMINENRAVLAVQPWGTVLPILAIGVLTVGVGLIADGLGRVAAGIDRREGRRDERSRSTGLRIDVTATGDDIVDEVTLSIAAGEVLGLVGESGSGKTTVGLAVLGHARKGAVIAVRPGGDRRLPDARPDRPAAAARPGPARQLRAAGPGHGAEPGAAHRQAAARGVRGPRLRRLRRRPAPAARRGDERGAAAVARRSSCAATRTSCRAASSSASAWRWRSPAGRR